MAWIKKIEPEFCQHFCHDPLEELQRIQIDSTDKSFSEEHKKELVHAALLALFFSGNFTQESFKLVLEFTKMFTHIKIPSSFNQLIKSIGENQIKKKYYVQFIMGYSKPSLDEFLIPLMIQLLELEIGFSYQDKWY